MHRPGTCWEVIDVHVDREDQCSTFPCPLLLWNSFLQFPGSSERLGGTLAWLSGEAAPPDAQAAQQLDLITLLKTRQVLARLAPKIAGNVTLGMKAAMGMCLGW